MLSLIVLSLVGLVCSTTGSDDLTIYFDLIDHNHDGRVTSEELAVFFDRFYEERLEPYELLSAGVTPTDRMMLDKLIQRHNRNATRKYLLVNDLRRSFAELYALQNQLPPVIYHGLDPEQVHLSYTHNVHTQMFISFVTRERPTANLRPVIKYGAQGSIAIGNTTTYNVID